jgi:regulator of protease activity HflC (stomatin/prohibitin superfamily)
MTVLAFLAAAAPSIIISLVIGGVVGAVVMGWLSARRRQVGGWGPGIGLGLLAALLVFGVIAYGQAYTPIERGTVGLVKRFGGLTGDVMQPGLNWRTPFIDKVVIVPTVKQSYETSDSPGTSSADYTDVAVAAQTVDGQQISVKYTVLFVIPPENAVGIVQDIGTVDRVVENVVKASSRRSSRVLAQNYSAQDLYSGEGILEYELAVRAALSEEFEPNGIRLDSFLIRKIDFDAEYTNAIEQQQIAQEAIETARYQAEAAEYEKERQIRLAEAEAERTKLLAGADAERQRLLADSEAYSIEARGAALEQYPQLVQWEFVRNLEGITWGILPGDGITPLVPIPSFE